LAFMGERRGAYKVLLWKPKGKKQLGRHRRRWQDNIKMVFKKWDGGMKCIDLAPNRIRCLAFVKVVMNVRDSRKFSDILHWLMTC